MSALAHVLLSLLCVPLLALLWFFASRLNPAAGPDSNNPTGPACGSCGCAGICPREEETR